MHGRAITSHSNQVNGLAGPFRCVEPPITRVSQVDSLWQLWGYQILVLFPQMRLLSVLANRSSSHTNITFKSSPGSAAFLSTSYPSCPYRPCPFALSGSCSEHRLVVMLVYDMIEYEGANIVPLPK